MAKHFKKVYGDTFIVLVCAIIFCRNIEHWNGIHNWKGDVHCLHIAYVGFEPTSFVRMQNALPLELIGLSNNNDK